MMKKVYRKRKTEEKVSNTTASTLLHRHYPALKPDLFVNVKDFTEEMSEDNSKRLREEVQDYLADKQITTVEELISFLAKRRNAAVVPMSKNVNGSCCRVENPDRMPHDLTITLDCTSGGVPSIQMLYRPDASRSPICWKKCDDGGYCTRSPGASVDLTCGTHPPSQEIKYIPLAPNAHLLDSGEEEEEGMQEQKANTDDEATKKKLLAGKWQLVRRRPHEQKKKAPEENKMKGSGSSSITRSLSKSQLVGLMGGYLETIQKTLIQIALSSAIKAALAHYGRKSEYELDDPAIPPHKHIQIPQLKRFLGERTWSHRYISLSYEPHEDALLVRTGDDGEWEQMCKEPSCISIAEGLRGPHCKAHQACSTGEDKGRGLQAAVIKVICRAAQVANTNELMRDEQALERLMRRLAKTTLNDEKLTGVFGEWRFRIYLDTNVDGSQILAVDKVRGNANSFESDRRPANKLQVCQADSCLELFLRESTACPRCCPSHDYTVWVFWHPGDEYYIGTTGQASDLSNTNYFNNATVRGKPMREDPGWKIIKRIDGYYSEDEANSLVIAAHIAILIESLVFKKDVKLVRKYVKLGSLVHHFLQYLLGQAGLRLVVSEQMQPELAGNNPPPSWMSYEIRSERKDGEGVVYECYSEVVQEVYVGKTRGPGTECIAGYHYSGKGEDPSSLKKLVQFGKTVDKIVASIDGKTEAAAGSAQYNEHLEKAETVVILSRSILSGAPFKNASAKIIKGIVNVQTSDLTTSNPREFLYQLFNTLLQHYGESLNWEPVIYEDGTARMKPYLLKKTKKQQQTCG